MVIGVVTGLSGVLVIATGIYSLVRGRVPARDQATWRSGREFGSFGLILGCSLLLTSMTIIALSLGWRGPSRALAVAALILAAAAFYRVFRLVRRT